MTEKDFGAMTLDAQRAYIRERRADLDRRIASGEVTAARPWTYDKKGPPIRWGLDTFKE